nr:sterol desaturase family protein [Spirosomataceae bacterium]
MFELLKNLTQEQLVIVVSTPIYAVFIGAEIILSNWQHRGFYTIKDTFTNVYLMLLNMAIDFFSRGVTWGILAWIFQYRFIDIQTPWIYWLTLFILEDFLYYVLHVVDHYSRFFWASHVTHHSSEQFNLTVGFRSSVFQPLYRFIYFIPLSLLGFKATDIALVYAITQIYGILVHTSYIPKFKSPFFKTLEYVFVSPSHHRVHHASNVEYLDKNMGMCLIIWDRIFGTYQEEKEEIVIKYGLVSELKDRGPANIVFHEWVKIGKDLNKPVDLITKLKYVFMPPGWSHDGSSKTSNQLREE